MGFVKCIRTHPPVAQWRVNSRRSSSLLQDVVEEPFAGAVLRSPFPTERRSLLHFSQRREQRAVQFLWLAPSASSASIPLRRQC